MYQRLISEKLSALMKSFPVVTVTGPRQAGKTFLLKNQLKGIAQYRSLEDPDMLEFAHDDPRGFLNSSKPLIIDEVQRMPKLFSYIQGIVDERNLPGQFFLSGSQNFLLMEKISQSLAGRTAILHLLPLSLNELKTSFKPGFPAEFIFKGGYPRLWSAKIAPEDFYPPYIATYLERDIRAITAVHDLNLFQRFVKLCAARTGQEINLSTLALDTGVSYNTISSWLSVLEASFIIYRLPPYYKNFNKRLIKNSKLYFYDTGLVCSLLGIRSSGDLEFHSARGALFENFIITELYKHYFNIGARPSLFFWRDQAGHEIDCILEEGDSLSAIEIKASSTASGDHGKNIVWLDNIVKLKRKLIINTSDENQTRGDMLFTGWHNWIKNIGNFVNPQI